MIWNLYPCFFNRPYPREIWKLVSIHWKGPHVYPFLPLSQALASTRQHLGVMLWQLNFFQHGAVRVLHHPDPDLCIFWAFGLAESKVVVAIWRIQTQSQQVFSKAVEQNTLYCSYMYLYFFLLLMLGAQFKLRETDSLKYDLYFKVVYRIGWIEELKPKTIFWKDRESAAASSPSLLSTNSKCLHQYFCSSEGEVGVWSQITWFIGQKMGQILRKCLFM